MENIIKNYHFPHAPPHKTLTPGTYMVTGGTYHKEHFFNSNENLSFLHDTLLSVSKRWGWELQAWAVFNNHYHFIAQSPKNSNNLSDFISEVHAVSSGFINKKDNMIGRKVWYQYRETLITHQYSYLARLNYVCKILSNTA